MAKKERNGLKSLPEMDMDEYNQKLREHRIKVFRRTSILVLVLLLIAAGLGIYMALRQYEDFDILASVERADTNATVFESFNGNILKYNNDGAVYTDTSNEMIWNQSFEMSEPTIDICENYVVIYDKKGTQIYIMSITGMVGTVQTTMPIQRVSVANQGTIAVLMDNDSAGYLALYDKNGDTLASGAIHGENGGYPIAIALSNDAIKLAVSMLDINDGNVKTTIAFYNFGSVGENEIDHIVSANSFSDMVIPEIDFITSDCVVAYADTEIIIFEGTQKPKLETEIPLTQEVKSIFHNEKYIGIVTNNDDETASQHISVYDMKGSLRMEKDFNMEYSNIEFLDSNEICITNANACDIYTIKGIYKFHYEFEEGLYKVISGGSMLNYTFILDNATEKVRLK